MNTNAQAGGSTDNLNGGTKFIANYDSDDVDMSRWYDLNIAGYISISKR